MNETVKPNVKKDFSVPGVASVVNHLLDCVKAFPLVWDVEGFKYMWEGGIVTTDPCDGSLQVEEALLLQQRTESPSICLHVLQQVFQLLTLEISFGISSVL